MSAKPSLSREAVAEAMRPPNNCAVKRFRDEELDDESRAVFDEACLTDKADLPTARLRDLLIATGYPKDKIPGLDAINDHRAGRRPCRCRG